MRTPTRLLLGTVAAVLVAAVVGCSAASSGRPEAGAGTAVVTPAPSDSATAAPGGTAGAGVRVAVVGDSLTAGGGRSLSDGLTANTWIAYAQGDGVDYVGGWAVGGTTVQQMARAVTPVDDVDVLVLMAGTNDVRKGISFAASAASYDSIVATIRPAHVVIGAIPPYDRDPRAAARYERQLAAYAATKGWDLVDPWGFARDGLRYAPGTTDDGIHPTTAGYQKIGVAYRAAILRVMSVPQAG